MSAGVEMEKFGLVFLADGGFVDVVICQVEGVDVVGAGQGAHGQVPDVVLEFGGKEGEEVEVSVIFGHIVQIYKVYTWLIVRG